ncbi:SEC14-like protein 4 isoform X2 [Argiope bruennichi]|uniref:SEC14-like protein 4 like protein n=1 Tax=Argiope bruennichi TaxID=94029 RepID=A0A8T0EL48_ARGBR|nr:SEC14-like protein 4 isoform X2 [Argiope bruennichi]KAF8774712.1 SEC14-like protein 4 like protein [Argiope bruennichi]
MNLNRVRHKNALSKKSFSCSYIDLSMAHKKVDYNNEENRKMILKEFRRVLKDILQPHHDDEFLLRWLRARDFDIIKSEKMIRESFKFRKKIGADTILTEAYQLPEVFQKYPVTYSLGLDSENSAVRLFMPGICDYKGYVSSLKMMDLMKLLVYFLEYDLNLLQQRKEKIGNVDTKSTFILDFTEFELKKFYDKSVINAGIQLITMYQDNYPETLKAAYLVNVPSYFNWIFNIFKPFLNAVTLSKIKVYKTDEWQDEVKKTLDPAVLPAFLGGTKTDPDGNPKCLTMINWDSKIDPSFYLKQNMLQGTEEDESMKTTTVQQRSVFQLPVEVKKPGALLKWVFKTKDYNIRFGLFYKKDEKSKQEEILPVDNVDCQVIPEENEFICEKTGIYILHWDNSYSWMTAKQLLYKAEVEDPNEANNN